MPNLHLTKVAFGCRTIDAVVKRVGMEGLNRVWERPENMPTLEEIRDPGLWIDRVEAA